MKNLLLLLFGLLFCPAISQVQISGIIRDAKTDKTIPYANVYLKNQPIGTTAFRDGSFSLKLDSVFRDSVIFSIIGYEPKSLFLPDAIKTKVVAIKLELTQEELKEVEVLPRKLKSYEAGFEGNWFFPRCGYGISAGRKEARFIANEYQIEGFVKSISVYVRNAGVVEAPFRVNMLSVNKSSGKPGDPIIEKDFILKAEKGNEWVTLNLQKELILFPDNGLFVSVEGLPLDSLQMLSYISRFPQIEPEEFSYRAPMLGCGQESLPIAFDANWRYDSWRRNEWVPETRMLYDTLGHLIEDNFLRETTATLMIKAEISYYADQKLKVKDLKTKRAVKKVFDRPKENTLKYPQSTPSYLLSSLKQAFEANDLAYACSYLVYYDDKDELEETMAFVESMKDTLGEARLTEKEIENITVLVSSLEAELKNLKPSDGERFIFELKLKDEVFYFQNKDGAWKINPRSTSLLQNREAKIPARF